MSYKEPYNAKKRKGMHYSVENNVMISLVLFGKCMNAIIQPPDAETKSCKCCCFYKSYFGCKPKSFKKIKYLAIVESPSLTKSNHCIPVRKPHHRYNNVTHMHMKLCVLEE